MNFSVVLDLTIECHGDIQKRTQYIKQNRMTFSGFGVVGFFYLSKSLECTYPALYYFVYAHSHSSEKTVFDRLLSSKLGVVFLHRTSIAVVLR